MCGMRCLYKLQLYNENNSRLVKFRLKMPVCKGTVIIYRSGGRVGWRNQGWVKFSVQRIGGGSDFTVGDLGWDKEGIHT